MRRSRLPGDCPCAAGHEMEAGRPSVDEATSRGGAERRVLEHAWLVLDELDAAVEGAMLDHLEGDVRVAVVDAFFARGPGDHREYPDSEAVDESGSQQGPAQAEAADRAEEPRAILLHGADRLDGVVADERAVGPRQWLLERGGEHHLGRSRELVDRRLLLGPELVLPVRDLAGSEARHQAVGVRSHQVGGLGLLAEPGEVLRALEAPEPGPSLSRCVAVEGGDEVDEKLRHGGVPSSSVTSSDRPGVTNSSAALWDNEKPSSALSG